MRLRFLSGNEHKIAEAKGILGPMGIDVLPIQLPIAELQTDELEYLVRDKTLRAFGQLGHPVFVEQTALYLDVLNGFPGGLTQPFWDRLKAEKMSELFGQGDNTGVTAKTRIGYCDGRTLHQFEGEIKGRVPSAPRGPQHFQWDCVFEPEGHNQTFAEMGDKKNDISMRKIALERLASHLKEAANA